MDFSLTPEQKEFKRSVLKFAKNELNRDVIERDHSSEFDWEGWKKCAELGIQALPIPEEYGGVGEDIVTCMLAMQALGYGCTDAGLLFSLHSHMWTCEIPILTFGSDEQKKKYLPRMAAGEIVGGHAMTEPGAGSDAYSLMSTAEKKGDRYILNGSKTFISNAPIADVLLVFALTDKTKGWAGISGFLVDKGTKGFIVGNPLHKMGLRTSPTAEVTLEDCEVPEECRLGREGAGSAIFNAEMEWERSCLFSSHLGMMQRQLDKCVQYAKDRKQFGQSIGKFQAVSHKMADMRMRIELGELILHKVAWLKGKGKKAHLESAIAKLFISESAVQNSLDAVQIHGGYGFMTEYEVERDLRDTIGGKLYSGTSEIQRNIIASWLGL
ncbi:MAG: acyl-CoA dehydrogenase family protein [Myxococcales bacterium]|nr:acyl-CoA dehydrogenase family protein [Myxococcales bacterium]